MAVATPNGTIGPLDAMDPSLPFLASDAAIELDNFILGNNCGFSAVERLARRLENSTEEVEGGQSLRSLMDATTVNVLSSAVAASGASEVRTLAELAEQASRLASALHGSTAKPVNKPQLESLRSFCVYLSQSAIAHDRSIFERHNTERHRS